MNAAPNDPDIHQRLTVLETRFDTILPTLATKSDLEALRGEVYSGFEKLRAEMEKLRTEMERMRGELFKAQRDTMKWLFGIVVTMFISLLGFNFAMFNSMKNLFEIRSAVAIERPVSVLPQQKAPNISQR